VKTQDDKDPNNKLKGNTYFQMKFEEMMPNSKSSHRKVELYNVNNKQIVMTVFASLKILIFLFGSMKKF
jgi:hypothetical protein